MPSRSRALAVLMIASTSMVLSACAGAPFVGDRSAEAFAERLHGTWIESSGDGAAAIVLSEDGTFEAHDLPAALACGGSAGDPELEACRADPRPSSISTDGTWSVLDEEQGMLELDVDGRLLAVGYRDFDGFFAESFSLGFYTGALDVREPDHVFSRR
ncbi:hypothetical protein [Frigoribacterium sp. CFBP 13712]|uniref:hypothetical protein n=1 Tax=Frigoribacterium sp. CFBP 13712 TaxID=2775309 RepID=UPI00177F496C|nr:hypothetical protein [Frigoribacterium sp. CFBP 13712]MBD8704848.1 hypothetical protein [Frigoribacterium sp. CFBP 13712]